MIKPGTRIQTRHQSTVHKHMEEVMDPEVATTATEEIKEAITINTEVDTKATKTTGNLSIWMTEEIISGTLMGTRLTHQKNMMQPLPFILQVWKVTEVIEAEGLREEEEDPIEDMDPAKEEEEEHNMVPETKVRRGIAWCAKSKDTIHYFTAPSYQNIFPEVITSNQFPEDYVNSASQLLVTSRIVLINSQGTTMTGCASRARLTSYSARIVRNIKLHRIG